MVEFKVGLTPQSFRWQQKLLLLLLKAQQLPSEIKRRLSRSGRLSLSSKVCGETMPTMQLRPWRHEKGMHLQNARSSDIGLIEQCSTRFRIQPVHYCADFTEMVLGDMTC